jgi:hypothetical protein
VEGSTERQNERPEPPEVIAKVRIEFGERAWCVLMILNGRILRYPHTDAAAHLLIILL